MGYDGKNTRTRGHRRRKDAPPKPDRVTPESLGWSASDPDCLTMEEIEAAFEQYRNMYRSEAKKALNRTGRGEHEDYVSSAMHGMWEGLFRYRRSHSNGAAPTSYAVWHLLVKVRTQVRHEAARGFYAPTGKGEVYHAPMRLFGEIDEYGDAGNEDKRKMDPAGPIGAAAFMTAAEQDRFWAVIKHVLPRREFNVIEAYYRRNRSAVEIGAALHVSNKRVHQMIERSMRRLREPDVARRLLEYIGNPEWTIPDGRAQNVQGMDAVRDTSSDNDAE